MSNCPFCDNDSVSSVTKQTRVLGRAWRGTQWIAPTAVLVLIPKCPLCVAAYVALSTGISITVGTARCIQILALAICVMSLAYLVARYCRTRRV
jgi:hypothetical protein